MNKDNLAVLKLRVFLQAHLREKLFQDLMCARQEKRGTTQRFLYCVTVLKQRVLFTSKLPDASIQYSQAVRMCLAPSLSRARV